MDRSPHVMLVGAGAEEFARTQGMELVSNEYFRTAARQRQLERHLRGAVTRENELEAFGTVGAVARDARGNLAAATSTGGMTGKRWGRIGDSPLIGAGTYADDRSGAVSSTGWGEYFIRVGVAHEICARMRLNGDNGRTAAEDVLAEVKALGGDGGVIVVTSKGEIVQAFNTAGMNRGKASKAGRSVALYGDEER
jgi:beta-aspartyl-peptidase (threonine type)